MFSVMRNMHVHTINFVTGSVNIHKSSFENDCNHGIAVITVSMQANKPRQLTTLETACGFATREKQ